MGGATNLSPAADHRYSQSCTANDDDEWEFEYDDEETDDFYVTLDLTSQVEPVDRRRLLDINTKQKDRTAVDAEINDQSQQDNANLFAQGDEQKEGHGNRLSNSNADRLQILDLHGERPLISYRNKILQCTWSTAIGTDLLFTVPSEPDADDAWVPAEPLASTSHYNLIAATPHRLVAKPAVLQPHQRDNQISQSRQTPEQASSRAAPPPSTDARRSDKEIQRAAQENVLARLAAIKLARGETEKVPAFSTNSNDRPRTMFNPSGAPVTTGIGAEQPDDESMMDVEEDDVLDDHTVSSPATRSGRGAGRGARGRSRRLRAHHHPRARDEVFGGLTGDLPEGLVPPTPRALPGRGTVRKRGGQRGQRGGRPRRNVDRPRTRSGQGDSPFPAESLGATEGATVTEEQPLDITEDTGDRMEE